LIIFSYHMRSPLFLISKPGVIFSQYVFFHFRAKNYMAYIYEHWGSISLKKLLAHSIIRENGVFFILPVRLGLQMPNDLKSRDSKSPSVWSFFMCFTPIWPKRQCHKYVAFSSFIFVSFGVCVMDVSTTIEIQQE
jgi:hypothetical protein